MNSANKDKRRFKRFEIRWNEYLGRPECPYMRRWIFNFWLFSIRIHQWFFSDDYRYMHDHAFDFITIVIKGGYIDVSPKYNDILIPGSIRFRKAEHKHYVNPLPGTITLLICGPWRKNWGFWVKGKFFRPLRFFNRYGHPPCQD